MELNNCKYPTHTMLASMIYTRHKGRQVCNTIVTCNRESKKIKGSVTKKTA